ncbi:hypothetical protein MRB53_034689 [Persea americana]|uniref:Uncharacterized protein n=1 Tax=Persea americana TaxID=3435 RepID=A0ACC2K300_PERAE|nr:hypothetical protein MRB53_034689 [Persea americana]
MSPALICSSSSLLLHFLLLFCSQFTAISPVSPAPPRPPASHSTPRAQWPASGKQQLPAAIAFLLLLSPSGQPPNQQPLSYRPPLPPCCSGHFTLPLRLVTPNSPPAAITAAYFPQRPLLQCR